MRKIAIVASFVLGTGCWLYAAQRPDPQATPPAEAKGTSPTKISDFAWIAGAWRTHVGPDVLEETWNPPLGNQMLGMFQWQKDGKVWLNELVSITQDEDDKITFRLRHFGPDMTAWEDKDSPLHYPLVRVKPGEAVFENPQRDQPRRFTYTQPAKDTLVVRIEGYDKGELSKTEYTFTRR